MKQTKQTTEAMPIDKGNGHTPGEWKYVNIGAIQRVRQSTKTICDCYSFSEGISDEEAEANAKLIASAPQLLKDNKAKDETIRELLEALKISENYITHFIQKGGIGEVEKDLSLIQKAIAKHNQ